MDRNSLSSRCLWHQHQHQQPHPQQSLFPFATTNRVASTSTGLDTHLRRQVARFRFVNANLSGQIPLTTNSNTRCCIPNGLPTISPSYHNMRSMTFLAGLPWMVFLAYRRKCVASKKKSGHSLLRNIVTVCNKRTGWESNLCLVDCLVDCLPGTQKVLLQQQHH
uniref:HDC19711 n=1 Tax=Drosophila melanogaster TaxID=7227 RepID=Q6II53_DROME|nr:TPA_inf: HDC19711 [Drosophila melanogaster]